MTLRQRNDTLTGHVWDEYGEQFGRSKDQHCVNNLRGVRLIPKCVQSNFVTGQLVAR